MRILQYDGTRRWSVAEQALTAFRAPDGRAAAPPASPAARALLPTAADGVELVAKFFRALGDPARLRLLEFLLPAEHTVSECVEHIGLSQGRVSVHLACLADCGYVEARRSGRFAWYKVTVLADCVRIPPGPSEGS